MLRNCDTILKNGNNIFESQVVESYLNMSSCCAQNMRLTTDGITASDPLYVYYQTPTATLKNTYTSDLSGTQISFPLSADNCVKPYYLCGNLNSVTTFCIYQSGIDAKWSGDLSCALSQFPNLECAILDNRETDFNNDISNTAFPRNLKVFKMYDKGIQGDLTTVENIGSIECWRLYYTLFSGNFHDIDFGGSLCCTCIQYAGASLSVNVESLIDDNSGYTHSYIQQSPGLAYCADTVDISNLTHLEWYGAYGNAKGTWGIPDFNTGITTFSTTSCCVNADLTNWDISDTQLTCFNMYNMYGNVGHICGSLSGWTLPSTLEIFALNYARDVTDVKTDWVTDSPDLRSLTLSQMQALSGDVTTWNIPTGLTGLAIYYTQLTGNLEEFDFPVGITSLQMRYNCFTGTLADIGLPSGSSQYYLDGNYFDGNVADLTLYPAQTYLSVVCNPNLYLDLNTPMDTCNLYSIQLGRISGITGSFNNLTIGNALQYLYLCYTPIESDMNELDISNLRYLYANYSSLSQDVTPMFTGSTPNLDALCLNGNPDLSGDTTNWQLDCTGRLLLHGPNSLCGSLSHACPYCMNITSTDICSCIETDFDFSVRSYNIALSSSCVQGNLSGITLYYPNIYQFLVNSNPDVYGANCFTNDIFVNRKNFGRSYVTLYYYSIGDYVTGTSETLGDLGTYAGDPTGMDLTEEQVNNLVAGTDWNSSGTNTPWSERSKIYWMKNACISSSSTTKRYSTFNISYSYN